PKQPAEPESRALLRFVLDGLDPGVPPADAAVTVTLRPSDGRPTGEELPSRSANGGPRPTFDVDVTSLVPAGRGTVTFDVTLERAGYLPVSQQVAVWFDSRMRPDRPTSVNVRMHVAGFVAGIVQDERFARIADADVGAFVR